MIVSGYASYAQKMKKKAGLQTYIDQIVKPYIDKKQTYGLSVGIIYKDNIATLNYGRISDEDDSTPNINTIYHIGSISKVFATSILLAMEEEGLLKITDSIYQYLPDSLFQDNPALKNITLADLASHTSGLPKESGNLALTVTDPEIPYANYTLNDAYRFLMDYEYLEEKRSQSEKEIFNYSHLGIGLLGHILETASGGKTYSELMKQYISKPLNLKSTAIALNEKQYERLASGHLFGGKKAMEASYRSLYASEAMRSSVNDLLRFLAMHLGKYKQYKYTAVLDSGLVSRHKTAIKSVYVGYGWYVIDQGKRFPQIYTHSGRTAGYSNYIAFTKDPEIAVVVLSNSAVRVDNLGIQILELLMMQKEKKRRKINSKIYCEKQWQGN